MKVQLWHRFSELDKTHEFGICMSDGRPSIFLTWVYFHLGLAFGDNRIDPNYVKIYSFPFEGYIGESLLKEYKTTDAKNVANWIFARLFKVIKTTEEYKLEKQIISILQEETCVHPYAFIIGDGEMRPAKCLSCGKWL